MLKHYPSFSKGRSMQHSWLVLLPPLIVLVASFITRNLNKSLILGIISAALIATDFSLFQAVTLAAKRLYETVADIENLYMFGFILILSILIVLINHTGGASAFANAITHKLKNKRAAETASLTFSLTLFIDDYLNGLTVGYVMRPLTDRFAIPRVKLAFLVRALTGPLVILAPLSSWVAVIIGTIDQAGVNPIVHTSTKIISDPFFLYLESIPYIFYSFFIIASAWFIVRMRLSFGPMHAQEVIAHQTGNLFGGKNPIEARLGNVHQEEKGSVSDLIVPLLTLFTCAIAGSMWAGGYTLFGGTHTLLDSFKHNTNITLVLFTSGIITLCVSYVFAYMRNKIKTTEIMPTFKEGFDLIISAIYMVILAMILGKLLRIDLLTGEYLAQTLLGSLPLFLMPLVFFLVSTLISAVTGSTWGTIMILIPVALPMLMSIAHAAAPALPESIPLLIPSLGAIFSGSVCGNNISPIADGTVMVSTSCGAYPLDHAHTQFLYILPSIIGTCVSYSLIGFFVNYGSHIQFWGSLSAGMLTTCGILLLFNRLLNKTK